MWSLLDAGTDVDPSFVALEERVIPDAIADVPIAREAAITATVPRSNPATALIEQALGAAALVVGTRGRGRLMTSMLGSVSHDVLLNVPCPVLVTPKECSFASDASRGDEAW
ncbi:universal stress protein [Leifsonia sp. 2MCAF36]|uniref:universal stress protein n=1 Tax=Leifsonia sp. 2MCAF36 TaxID=3232988 RepID=UPI003F9588BC